jgi:glycosyltransferase involved in cell wall biosynthesis
VFPEQNYHEKTAAEIMDGVTRALDRIDPQVVATNGWSVPEARAGLSWCRRRRRRCVVMSESKADDRPRIALKELVKRVVVSRFDAALVGGRAHADYLTSLGFPAERIQLGYDAVDHNFFADAGASTRADPERARAGLGLPGDYFFACTRFLSRKNVDGLLRGYALYRAAAVKPVWDLVIAGSGEEEGRLHALEGDLGLTGVTWPGFVQYPELPIYFSLAGAFIHPAKSEAWGLVVNEAAATGTPLLVSRTVGAAQELVRDGENGFLFDPNSVQDIASVLHRIAERTAEERSVMGSAAQRTASKWGPERFGSGLLAAAGL